MPSVPRGDQYCICMQRKTQSSIQRCNSSGLFSIIHSKRNDSTETDEDIKTVYIMLLSNADTIKINTLVEIRWFYLLDKYRHSTINIILLQKRQDGFDKTRHLCTVDSTANSFMWVPDGSLQGEYCLYIGYSKDPEEQFSGRE